MRETERFLNEGRGWECKRCRDAEGAKPAGGAVAGASPTLPRFFREGEAEERETRLSARTLARWKDESRRALVCPRCGAEEDLQE